MIVSQSKSDVNPLNKPAKSEITNHRLSSSHNSGSVSRRRGEYAALISTKRTSCGGGGVAPVSGDCPVRLM